MTRTTPGSIPTIDCADEPIRIPGSVQPHGVLLAVSPDDLRVVMASAGAQEHLGLHAADLVGRPLHDVVGQDAVPHLPLSEDALEPHTVTIAGPSGAPATFELLAHESGGLLVLELEPHRPTQDDRPLRTRLALRALQGAGTQVDLSGILAREVRSITGFDRVMVYRFDPEWNGEVVAEDAREDLEPFLGLHYPASDIPAQARALYTTQWLRSIPDARYTPSPLVPSLNPLDGNALDLSGSALRSVSPVHLQYLDNMGVRASMSVSLIVHGRLWGLVACHHYDGPHFPSAVVRGAAEFLGRTASLLLQGKEDEARHVDSLAIAATSAELARELAAQIRNPMAVLTRDDRVLDLVEGATGAAIRINGELGLVGETPDAADVDALHDLLWEHGGSVVVSDSLSRDLIASDLPRRMTATASGVLAVRLGAAGSRDFLAWFRPEVLREVHWAGDPHTKGMELTEAGLRLTPRASFAAWVEQVRGRSETWTPSQVAAAERLGQDIDELLTRRKHEEERVAAALRRIVLTERPPTPPGYAIAQRFQPSGDDALGGDWYDITALPDGRVVFMVGDVAGHGIAVAAITAQIRHALRAYLVDEGGAAAALRRLGSLIATLLPGELATVIAVELDADTGTVRVCRAGHLPVLHLGGDGARFVEGTRGPALGVHLGSTTDFNEVTLRLEPGDCLALYTDGLVEERGTRLELSLERLRARAAEIGPDIEALCDRLLAQAPVTKDDVTMLVLQRT